MNGQQVLVLGGGDVGSAVAHALHQRGDRVLLCDRDQSTHARRGMAYTDALFEGRATLEGVEARFCASIAEVRQCWMTADSIPICTQPDELLLREKGFDVLVDASMRRDPSRPDRRAFVDCVIGLGPGYAPGSNCHVAVETQWGPQLGKVLRDRPAAARSGGPRLLDGVGRERFVCAPATGRWSTTAVIGMSVVAGQALGRIGEMVVTAPISGCLRGLSRDGVDVSAGQRIVEVDPRHDPQVFGRGERPLLIARGVVQVLDARDGWQP